MLHSSLLKRAFGAGIVLACAMLWMAAPASAFDYRRGNDSNCYTRCRQACKTYYTKHCQTRTRYQTQCRDYMHWKTQCRNYTTWQRRCRGYTVWRQQCRHYRQLHTRCRNYPAVRRHCVQTGWRSSFCVTQRRMYRQCSNYTTLQRRCQRVPRHYRSCQNVPVTRTQCARVPQRFQRCSRVPRQYTVCFDVPKRSCANRCRTTCYRNNPRTAPPAPTAPSVDSYIRLRCAKYQRLANEARRSYQVTGNSAFLRRISAYSYKYRHCLAKYRLKYQRRYRSPSYRGRRAPAAPARNQRYVNDIF